MTNIFKIKRNCRFPTFVSAHSNILKSRIVAMVCCWYPTDPFVRPVRMLILKFVLSFIHVHLLLVPRRFGPRFGGFGCTVGTAVRWFSFRSSAGVVLKFGSTALSLVRFWSLAPEIPGMWHNTWNLHPSVRWTVTNV